MTLLQLIRLGLQYVKTKTSLTMRWPNYGLRLEAPVR